MTTAPRIPQPLARAIGPDFAIQAARLIGQPPLRSSIGAEDRGAGVARVTVQVRSSTFERCAGYFRVHVFASATPGGAIIDQADRVTDDTGQCVVDLTAGAGSRHFYAAVVGVYDGASVTVT